MRGQDLLEVALVASRRLRTCEDEPFRRRRRRPRLTHGDAKLVTEPAAERAGARLVQRGAGERLVRDCSNRRAARQQRGANDHEVGGCDSWPLPVLVQRHADGVRLHLDERQLGFAKHKEWRGVARLVQAVLEGSRPEARHRCHNIVSELLVRAPHDDLAVEIARCPVARHCDCSPAVCVWMVGV